MAAGPKIHSQVRSLQYEKDMFMSVPLTGYGFMEKYSIAQLHRAGSHFMYGSLGDEGTLSAGIC
jgi:hypothetical protein